MKTNILLTCFGDKIFYEMYRDFQKRKNMNLFVSDVNPEAKARIVTKQFISVLPAHHPEFCSDLLIKAKEKEIQWVIPVGDEETFALMRHRKQFEESGIKVAVQDEKWLPVLESKASVYRHLKGEGVPVPKYAVVRSGEELERVLKRWHYSRKPLLLKANRGRGGKGVYILSERYFENRDWLPCLNREMAMALLEDREEYLLMEYLQGDTYDVDVLKYQTGDLFFGIRRRLHNVSKLFSGNVFEENENIREFARMVYKALPTDYLVDYDLFVSRSGDITLLEVNPRSSGSVISYLPFGINLYSVLVQSHLEGKTVGIDFPRHGSKSVVFYRMRKD